MIISFSNVRRSSRIPVYPAIRVDRGPEHQLTSSTESRFGRVSRTADWIDYRVWLGHIGARSDRVYIGYNLNSAEPDRLYVGLGANSTDKIIGFDMCHGKFHNQEMLLSNPVTCNGRFYNQDPRHLCHRPLGQTFPKFLLMPQSYRAFLTTNFASSPEIAMRRGELDTRRVKPMPN